MLSNWGAVLFFLIIGFAFGVGGIVTSFLIQPRRPTKIKLETYECGPPTVGPAWVQFRVQYFIYALIFVFFDVETIFLYPWAVKFQALGLFAFVEMIVFIFILAIGLWYAWKEGAFKWI